MNGIQIYFNYGKAGRYFHSNFQRTKDTMYVQFYLKIRDEYYVELKILEKSTKNKRNMLKT